MTAPSSCLMVTASIELPAPTGTTGRPLPPAPTQLLLRHTWTCASTTAHTPISPFRLQTWFGTAKVARRTTCTAPAQTHHRLDICALTSPQTLPLTLKATLTTILCRPQVTSAVEKRSMVPTTTHLRLTATTIPTHTILSPPPALPTMISCCWTAPAALAGTAASEEKTQWLITV